MAVIPPEVPGPNPGQPGHYAHHDWLTDSVKALDLAIIPTGMVMPYAAQSAPAGWLFADGSAVSRTTFAALFAAIGTAFGVGDGSTTFNLPSLAGRVIAGWHSGQPDFTPVGKVGGAASKALTVNELPVHNHGATGNPNVSHTHTIPAIPANMTQTDGGGNSNPGPIRVGSSNGVYASVIAGSTGAVSGGHSVAHTHTTANAGAGAAFPTLPPYAVLSYLIKT